MKTKIFSVALMFAAMTLTACGSNNTSSSASAKPSTSNATTQKTSSQPVSTSSVAPVHEHNWEKTADGATEAGFAKADKYKCKGNEHYALRWSAKPYHAIIAAATAHIAVDECNAPGYLSGAAVKEVPTPDGKLTPDLIRPLLHGFGFEHHSQPRVVYVSEVTELGTVYTPDELRALADFVHSYGMYLHIDGARLANAAVSLDTTVRALTTDCGADIISFGGTKNGCMMAEAVIALRPELATELRYLRKQTTQLFSKMRYVAAQFLAYFDNDLLYKNAAHANAMAQLLRRRIEETGNFEFTQPTQANTLLLKLAPDVTEQLLKNHFFYVWDEQTNEIRLVTSWDTTEEDIESFVSDLKKIIEK